MPFDRHHASNTPARPLMPTLATTRSTKPPITPRLANQYSAATPPLARASARSASPAIRQHASKEDVSTPVRSFLNHNVTPRSASRKARVDSQQSSPAGTPNGTPTSTRPASTIDAPAAKPGASVAGGPLTSYVASTVGMQPGSASRRPLSMINGASATPTVRRSPANSFATRVGHAAAVQENSSMFFHASEARRDEPPPPPPKKSPTFFYANGGQEESSQRSSRQSSPALSAVSSRSKFFHADGTEELDDILPPIPPLSPPPTVSANPSSVSLPATSLPPTSRPASPKKDIHLSYRKGVSQVMRPNMHRQATVPNLALAAQSHRTGGTPSRRRSSASSAMLRSSHGKSASLSSIDSVPSRTSSTTAKKMVSPLPEHPRIVETGQNSSAPASATLPPESFKALPSIDTTIRDTPTSAAVPPTIPLQASTSVPQSPTKQNIQQLADLAADARRERKALDLEITNSSLLAINRQLERELRRQKQELRRFRRLSRAGRFSITSTMRSPSLGTTPEDEEVDVSEHLDLSEDEFSEEDDSLMSCSSSSSSVDLSPEALTAHDAKRLRKDEKRLRLDLTKHRELLIDSQKMNQSLKRCLGWTEELILEGRRALEYRVRVSDVRLGGRILTPDEHIDPLHAGLSDVSSDVEVSVPEPAEEDDDEDPQDDGDELEEAHGFLSAMSKARNEVTDRRCSGKSDLDSGVDVESRNSRIITDDMNVTASGFDDTMVNGN